MKTINRILISSVFLALISIAVVFAVVVITFFYLTPEYGKELLDENVFAIEEIIHDHDATTAEWGLLSGSLSEYGYNLLVIDGENIVFSDLDGTQTKVIESLKRLQPQDTLLAGKTNGVTFIAKPTGSHVAFALKGAVEDVTLKTMLTDFLPIYLLASLMATVVVLLVSMLFTRKMAWRVLRPLKALSEGARRIERGNLSEAIAHNSKDEFAQVATAFNHMQKSLLDERRKNAAYEKARIDMIAGISHDLRTPLTSVQGYIKGLQDGIANTPEKREQYLSIAYQKACDIEVLLQQLLFFSKLETGNYPMVLTFQDLGEFAKKNHNEMRNEFDSDNISLSIDVTSVPHPVKIDTHQMRRVLLNLTENAIRYAEAKPLSLAINVWRERGMEHLAFADNGKGIPESQLPYIFDRFWRGDEARRMNSNDGSGLGLYRQKTTTVLP